MKEHHSTHRLVHQEKVTNISKGGLSFGLDPKFVSHSKRQKQHIKKYSPRISSVHRSMFVSMSSVSLTSVISIILWLYACIYASNTLSFLSSVTSHFSQNYYYRLLPYINSISLHQPNLISIVEAVTITTKTKSAFLHRKQQNRNQYKNRMIRRYSSNNNNNIGGYDPSEGIEISERIKERSNVGNPQRVQVQEKEFSVTSILKELAAIQQQGPQKYCILGTRHCSYLHQQIIELLAYALVLSGNHVYTSGSSGTNAATIRGALRAERPDLLTVILPQSLMKQTEESQQLLKQVEDVIEMPQNNDLSLDIASRICNSHLISLTDQLISFAFHESTTVIEAAKEAKELNKLVTVLFLD